MESFAGNLFRHSYSDLAKNYIQSKGCKYLSKAEWKNLKELYFGRNFNINIIDTPGLFEITQDGQHARADAQIMDMITDCLKHEVTKLNMVVLFCSLIYGINDTDIYAMEKLIEHLGTEVTTVICITRGEQMTEEVREENIEQLKQYRRTKDLINLVEGRVIFSGSIDAEKVVDEKSLNSIANRIMDDRQYFLNLIFACVDYTKIHDLKFIQLKQKEIIRRISVLCEEIKSLLDRDADEKESISDFEVCCLKLDYIKESMPLFNEEAHKLYVKMTDLANELYTKFESTEIVA